MPNTGVPLQLPPAILARAGINLSAPGSLWPPPHLWGTLSASGGAGLPPTWHWLEPNSERVRGINGTSGQHQQSSVPPVGCGVRAASSRAFVPVPDISVRCSLQSLRCVWCCEEE